MAGGGADASRRAIGAPDGHALAVRRFSSSTSSACSRRTPLRVSPRSGRGHAADDGGDRGHSVTNNQLVTPQVPLKKGEDDDISVNQS